MHRCIPSVLSIFLIFTRRFLILHLNCQKRLRNLTLKLSIFQFPSLPLPLSLDAFIFIVKRGITFTDSFLPHSSPLFSLTDAPENMRDIASCFGEYAIQVSDTSCSTISNNSCISPSFTPSILNAVTSSYRITLSNRKQITATVTWSRNSLSQSLSIAFAEDTSNTFKLSINSRLFRKLKGNKSIELNSNKIDLFWDFSTARYGSGPEPVNSFYLFITVDSELGLALGDMAREAAARKLRNANRTAKSSLISRREHFSGNTHYSTKAQFCDSGRTHDISIRCNGENEGLKHPALSVSIDKKTVIRVKRLQWNFRGNQTIFLDGLLVDFMWDVHDWFYNSDGGNSVFMFRTRSGLDSRLWMEEDKLLQKDEDKVEFSLMICACKN